MTTHADKLLADLMAAATPVLAIHGVGGRPWFRNVTVGDKRKGPWPRLVYSVHDQHRWSSSASCLYLVSGADGGNRYVGVSRNKLKDRWRLSPGTDAEDGSPLTERQLFHSQCMEGIYNEITENPTATFRVSVIYDEELLRAGQALASSLLTVPRSTSGNYSLDVEAWLCRHRSERIARWNKARTKGRKAVSV
jgi:hypothetical protein